VLGELRQRGAERIEPTETAEAEWVQTIMNLAVFRADFLEQCTPGYYNNEGKPSQLAARNGPYGLGPIAFFKVLDDWRAAGDLQGMELA
jgi:cyclohexanone monooxygenase